MGESAADDYLSGLEADSWTWRVEDTWGEAGERPETPAQAAPRTPGEQEPDRGKGSEESGEYLGADPLETDWSRTWYTVGKEREESETAEPLPGTTRREDAAPTTETRPGTAPVRPGVPTRTAGEGAAPLAGISLAPLTGTWDDESDLVQHLPWLRRTWDEKGKTVLMPTALVLLVLLGIVMMVLNVVWASRG